ncbi:hypothetical protein, partial [Escherichia coli]|uniref:hypothetical protein n=1 Tax=Escherichia coli TaxID=562 RepID=UPI0033064D7C
AEIFGVIFLVTTTKQRNQFAIEINLFESREEVIPVTLRFAVIGTEPSAFPDTLPGYTEYGRDNGIRLSAVWLTHDPEYPENLPAAPLVRYGWTP